MNAPPDLGEAGTKLWDEMHVLADTAEGYEFDEKDLHLLELACRQSDDVALLEDRHRAPRPARDRRPPPQADRLAGGGEADARPGSSEGRTYSVGLTPGAEQRGARAPTSEMTDAEIARRIEELREIVAVALAELDQLEAELVEREWNA
jgi:hypothetical protein